MFGILFPVLLHCTRSIYSDTSYPHFPKTWFGVSREHDKDKMASLYQEQLKRWSRTKDYQSPFVYEVIRLVNVPVERLESPTFPSLSETSTMSEESDALPRGYLVRKGALYRSFGITTQLNVRLFNHEKRVDDMKARGEKFIPVLVSVMKKSHAGLGPNEHFFECYYDPMPWCDFLFDLHHFGLE